MRKFAFWLGFICVTVAGQASALEVGEVQVRSYLNEPLVATVPVQVANISERNSLAATLAAETEYVARGLQPLAKPDDLIVQVTDGGGLEQMLIELRSLSEINEPYMSIVLQLVWDGGSEVREFTLLLDPAPAPVVMDEPAGLESADDYPVSEDSALQQLAEDLSGEPGAQVSGPKPTVVIRKVHPDDYLAGKTTSGSSTSTPGFTGDKYGPVAPGETLWRIATMVRPSNAVSMNQVMEAIFQANPGAFDGSYNTLRKGAMLAIPTEQEMRNTAGGQTTTARQDPVESQAATGDAAQASSEEAKPGIWMPQQERAATIDSKQIEKKGGLITKSGQPPAVQAQEEAEEQPQESQPAPAPSAEGAVPAELAPEAAPGDEGRVDYAEQAPTIDSATAVESAPLEAPAALPAPDAQAETEAESAPEAQPASTTTSEDDSVEDLVVVDRDMTSLLAGIILLVLLATYWWYRRRRAAEAVTAYSHDIPVSQEVVDAEPQQAPSFSDEQDQVVTDNTPDALIDEVDEPQDTAVTDDQGEAIAQADTYLSYGLYESAAEILQKGIDAEPQRQDLRLKLLETYETAGNAEAFIDAAKDWEASEADVGEADRERVIAMGQRVAPGISLFAAAAAHAETDEHDAITELGEEQPETIEETVPEEELPTLEFDLDSQAEEAPTASDTQELETLEDEPPVASEAESVALDLDLDSELDSPLEEPTTADEEIEDLAITEDLDISSPEPAASSTAEAPEESLEFDLGELDLEGPGEDLPDGTAEATLPETEPAQAFDLDEGLSLDEDLDTEAPVADEPEQAAVPDESEYDVKMDLAQAYLDMGEADLAKGLLEEVLEGGSAEQRDAAQKLLADLD